MNDAWAWAAIGLALGVVWIYARGLNESPLRNAQTKKRDAAMFIGGMAILALALSPPVHALAQRGLVQHMAQHIAIVVAAAPLIALARPLPTLIAGMPAPARNRLAPIARPLPNAALSPSAFLAVSALQALVFWGWHDPTMYDAAVRHNALHAFAHATFFISALAYWWAIVHAPDAGERGYILAMIASVATMIQGSMLGLLMLVAHAPWYSVYPNTSASLAEQQSAAALMWGTTGTVYMLAAAILLWRLLDEIDRNTAATTN
jgi:cytochrome c oxidase assembly factor CtaG